MAIDPNKHEVDPATGFVVDKETRHPIGIVPAPHARLSAETEWPKWVTPHESYIVRKASPGAPDHVSTPLWPEYHVDRVTGDVTVLVKDEDEETRAVCGLTPDAPDHPANTDATDPV